MFVELRKIGVHVKAFFRAVASVDKLKFSVMKSTWRAWSNMFSQEIPGKESPF